jgi:hypothetical protein
LSPGRRLAHNLHTTEATVDQEPLVHLGRLSAALLLVPALLLGAGCSSDDSSDGEQSTPAATEATQPAVHAFGLQDGSCPADKPVKAYETSKSQRVFAEPGAPGYADVRAAFCFVDPAAAKVAGFKKAS